MMLFSMIIYKIYSREIPFFVSWSSSDLQKSIRDCYQMRHEKRMLNSPDHILSLFELELQAAVLGDTEVGPAVAGLDGGVGEVAGVSPGQTRGHTVVRVTGRVTAGCRLLFPLARQGLGDGAAPHQIITGAVNILSEKNWKENVKNISSPFV